MDGWMCLSLGGISVEFTTEVLCIAGLTRSFIFIIMVSR